MSDETDVINACPYCHKSEGQHKAGISQGLQRYRCTACQRRYILDRRERGYPQELRQQAIEMRDRGMAGRQIARELDVSPATIVYWTRSRTGKSLADPTDAAPSPQLIPESPKGRSTIRDVARLSGVSTTTVSNYLNNKGNMRDEVRTRIEATMERIHFTPSALVRAIQRRRTRILGVVLFGIYELNFHPGEAIAPAILVGINRAADRVEYDILLYTGWPHRPKRFPGFEFLNGHTDGLLWIPPDMPEPALARIADAGLPVVAGLSRHVPDAVGYVNADNIGAQHLLVRHLRELGHRRIGYFGQIGTSNFLDRRDGYRAALQSHGLIWDPDLEVIETESPWTIDVSQCGEVLERWLRQADPPTAIMLPGDTLAGSMIEAIRARGLRVPEDISVCGFDDILDAQHIGGGLTTIRQPFQQIGELAVERLIARIEGAPVERCRVSVPTSLIVRGSTGRVSAARRG